MGASASIRIVQPNIGQQDKWREGFRGRGGPAACRPLATTVAAGQSPPAMIFWPEAAVTEPLADGRAGASELVADGAATGPRAASSPPATILVTGGLGLTSSDGRTVDGATNSVFVLKPDGSVVGRYDKAHLVPYGEYLPMRPLLSAIGLSRLAPGDIDFAPGPGPPRSTARRVGQGRLPALLRDHLFGRSRRPRRNRPDFIFNPSNDAWFGRWGPPQHLAQAQLRAAEEGLPVIRSTPTGISAVIDATARFARRPMADGWRD